MADRPETGVRKHRAGIVVGLVLVLVAAGVGGWTAFTGSLPFLQDKEHYCWGAWEQDSGPRVLGGEAVEGGGSRGVKESPPTAGRPSGSCTLTVRAGSGSGGEKVSYSDRVTVRYGAVPDGGTERRAWLGEFLDARSVRLPDGLSGTVGQDRAVVVLPKRCEAGGRPAAVSLRVHGRSTSASGEMANPSLLGTGREVATMLLDAANAGMSKADCARENPLELASSFPGATEESDRSGPVPKEVCDIPGLRGGQDAGTWSWTRADDARLRICTVSTEGAQGEEPELAGQFLIVTEPRLMALFDGMTGDKAPGPGWRGKGVFHEDYAAVRADCDGTDAVFFQQLDKGMREAAEPDPERVFARGVDAAAQRAGCGRVAPAG
ncbi:hypothetical protein [Streptomyces iconiensis]|uniref:Uncharacterized protein n=1 Tax=Streptomyces iconiensis TaxID=1384038 RepID=A0ABT6ZXH5_9ACTN|nr:hypothetical protein [Streptomyces iconiensis]MDJ1133765.1 hypothetical protein [Streptomyces iconiensis]